MDAANKWEAREFVASDGYRLHHRRWLAAGGGPRGFVVAMHGIQSHAGWYEYSSGRLAEAGYRVDFLDRRGSGRNQADRGHALHHERLISDVVQFLSDVVCERDRSTLKVPVILLAVSWGGKLAAAVVARRPELVDALVLLYPGICPRIQARWHQRLALWLARRLGRERKSVRLPFDDAALFTGEPRWQRFIRDDPLALHEATVGLLNASLALDRLAAAAPEYIRCPTLLMLAGRDEIIDNAATRRWFHRVAACEKQVIEYPAARHTLEFEPNREAICDDLIAWCMGWKR